MKVEKPLFSNVARGSLADILTYQERLTGGVVYQKKEKRDAKSNPQLVTRQDYSLCSYQWQNILNTDRVKWNNLAKDYGISGINLFVMWWFTELYNSISGVGFSNGFTSGAIRPTPKLTPYYMEGVRKKIYGV